MSARGDAFRGASQPQRRYDRRSLASAARHLHGELLRAPPRGASGGPGNGVRPPHPNPALLRLDAGARGGDDHIKPGPHTFEVRAVGPAGPDLSPANASFGISRPPNTRIAKAKINGKRHKATFRFRAIGKAKRFECELRR